MADSDPSFDLTKFKQIAKENLAKKSIKPDNSENVFTMSLALAAAVKKVFFEKSEQKFSSEPVIERKPIVQFVNRIRIDAMEKFNTTTFLSAIHYYKNAATMEKGTSIGLIVIYIERIYVPELLRLFKYPYIDYDDDAEVMDGIGAISNLIAGSFKAELARLGYADLEMSPFTSAINNVMDGLEYPKSQIEKYEISFEIDGKKRMVVEMVLEPLSKVMKND